MVESGRMTRSTDECEMSRSCQSATFSKAACAFARVTVARDDLGGDGVDFESEAFADLLFELGLEVRQVADRAGEFAHAHLFRGVLEAGNIALDLGVPVGQLQSEGDGLRVDAVRAAD